MGEYLDNDSGFYHLRARDYDPKIGRFVSRDWFEGIENNPITLNPYLYAHSSPINIVDPSGYMSLGDMMSGLNINSILSSSAIRMAPRGIMTLARKGKIYDIYTYATWPLHFYMAAIPKMKLSLPALRYDVGNDWGWGGMLENKKNWLGKIPSEYVASSGVKSKKDLKGKGKKVASHTFGQ